MLQRYFSSLKSRPIFIEIEALINALGQLKELRSVFLKLKQFECEHYGSLSESLTQLENLQELKLYFYQFDSDVSQSFYLIFIERKRIMKIRDFLMKAGTIEVC